MNPDTENAATTQDDNIPNETLDDAMDREFAMFEANPKAEYTGAEPPVEPSEPTVEPTTPEPDPSASAEPTEPPVPDPVVPEPEPAKAEPDAFDKETDAKLEKMKFDPHPGIEFKRVRDEVKSLKQQLREAQDGISSSEEVQKLRLQAEQSETYKTEAADLRSTLALNDYKRTDEYDTLVRKPMEEAKVMAKRIEEDNGLPEGSVLNIVKHGDAKTQDQLIEKLVEDGGLNRRAEINIYNMAQRHVQVSATDAALKGTAEERMSELNSMQVSKETAANEEQSKALSGGVEQTFARYEGKLPGFVTDEGLPTDQFNDLKSEAASTQLNTIEDASFAIFAATLLPEVLKTNKAMSEEIATKNRQLAKYGGAAPSANSPATPAKVVKKPTSFMDAMEEEFG
jgi:hypothetical protein